MRQPTIDHGVHNRNTTHRHCRSRCRRSRRVAALSFSLRVGFSCVVGLRRIGQRRDASRHRGVAKFAEAEPIIAFPREP